MLSFPMRCPAAASPVADSQDIHRQAHQSQAGSPGSHLISSPLDSFTSFFLFFLLNISILKEHIVLFLKILSWWLRWYRVHLHCRRPRFDPWVGKIPWRRKWQRYSSIFAWRICGQRNLVSCSPWGHKELDTTE